MEQRITDLEIRFTHEERTVQELNDIVCTQEQRLESLEREVKQIMEQLKMLLPSLVREQDEGELPPHY